jgi:hypothetical protein
MYVCNYTTIRHYVISAIHYASLNKLRTIYKRTRIYVLYLTLISSDTSENICVVQRLLTPWRSERNGCEYLSPVYGSIFMETVVISLGNKCIGFR